MEKKRKTEKKKNVKKKEEKRFILNRLGRGSFSSQRRGIRYFAFLMKVNDRLFAGFLAFIPSVVLHGSDLLRPSCRREMRGFLYY